MLCPTCQGEQKVVPAGISRKTGKPYRSFEVCENPPCKALKEASRTFQPVQPQNAPQGNFKPIDATVDDLQQKVDGLNLTIAKLRTWAKGIEEKISTHSQLLIDLRGKDAVEFHESFKGPTAEDVEKAFPGSKII